MREVEADMWPVFSKLVSDLHRLIEREDGQDLAEYALLAALIACIVSASVQPVAAALVVKFTYIASKLNLIP
jgi:Flp pilus assembly pilin Flp